MDFSRVCMFVCVRVCLRGCVHDVCVCAYVHWDTMVNWVKMTCLSYGVVLCYGVFLLMGYPSLGGSCVCVCVHANACVHAYARVCACVLRDVYINNISIELVPCFLHGTNRTHRTQAHLHKYAQLTFFCRTVLDGFVVQLAKFSTAYAEETERPRRIGIIFCWFICVLILAAEVPNIGVAIAMIGGVASLFIFIFPG